MLYVCPWYKRGLGGEGGLIGSRIEGMSIYGNKRGLGGEGGLIGSRIEGMSIYGNKRGLGGEGGLTPPRGASPLRQNKGSILGMLSIYGNN